MRRISLTLDENEFHKLMDFLKSFHSVENLQSKALGQDIPEWQQRELDEQLKAHEEGKAGYEDWEKLKNDLFSKYKVE